MFKPNTQRCALILSFIIFISPKPWAQSTENKAFKKTQLIKEAPFEYTLHQPNDFKPKEKYPVLLLTATSQSTTDHLFFKQLASASKRMGYVVYRYTPPSRLDKIKSPLKEFYQFVLQQNSTQPKKITILTQGDSFHKTYDLTEDLIPQLIILDHTCVEKNKSEFLSQIKKYDKVFLTNSHKNLSCRKHLTQSHIYQEYLSDSHTALESDEYYRKVLIYNLLAFLKLK